MSTTESSGEFETSITDDPVGETVTITISGEEVVGEVKAVEACVNADSWPDVGETLTFKAVGGETEKEVVAVDKSRDKPIQVGHGGWYERRNFVEYSESEAHKVIRLPDGRELWASPEEDDA